MPQFINIFELARRGETIEGEVAVKDLPNLLGFTATENGTLRFVATAWRSDLHHVSDQLDHF